MKTAEYVKIKTEYISKKVQGFKQYIMAKFDFIMQVYASIF